jgi:hypothetical protein
MEPMGCLHGGKDCFFRKFVEPEDRRGASEDEGTFGLKGFGLVEIGAADERDAQARGEALLIARERDPIPGEPVALPDFLAIDPG